MNRMREGWSRRSLCSCCSQRRRQLLTVKGAAPILTYLLRLHVTSLKLPRQATSACMASLLRLHMYTLTVLLLAYYTLIGV